ncbi:RDD family protein [Streptomyces sp. NPDC018610]|uniref:RDD family protein n=1 Tax=Streptomyces sp. NPDC018610 TaxID=3365049 RepID=UPI0037990B6E
MSAPTPAPGDDRPREGYYPDPSIPGYVRYWNGASWVPGTSRPAPADGEPLSPPPGVRPVQAATPALEETGPHFFDEDPVDEPGPAAGPAPAARPEPAAAWGADRARQSGFGGDADRRVSWGGPAAADPRLPRTDGQAAPGEQGDGQGVPPPQGQGQGPGQEQPGTGSTFVFRRPTADDAPGEPEGTPAPGVPGPAGPRADDGTMTFRPVPGPARRGGPAGAGPAQVPAQASPLPTGPGAPQGPVGAPEAPGFGAGKAAAARASSAQGHVPGQAQAPGQGPHQAQGLPPHQGQAPAAMPAAAHSAPPAAPVPPAPSVPSLPHQSGAQSGLPQPAPAALPAPAPVTSGPGGGQASWAQQVHQLAGAGEDQPVAPWKPPVEDLFQAAARRQAEARPAGLGRRLAARLVDSVVLAAVTAVAAVPLGAKAVDHVEEKIDAAKLSGQTVTVWLLDGTTATCLGIVLAVLLLFGVVYEALPTAKWGRTLGKKLCGLQVRDIEGHEPPSFGAALRRWLVYGVPGLLGIGLVGVLWCLFDRPWHQCWHDKAAHTFVAG